MDGSSWSSHHQCGEHGLSFWLSTSVSAQLWPLQSFWSEPVDGNVHALAPSLSFSPSHLLNWLNIYFEWWTKLGRGTEEEKFAGEMGKRWYDVQSIGGVIDWDRLAWCLQIHITWVPRCESWLLCFWQFPAHVPGKVEEDDTSHQCLGPCHLHEGVAAIWGSETMV